MTKHRSILKPLLATGFLLSANNTSWGQSTVQFASASYVAAESAGSVTLTVQRSSDPNAGLSVSYATADGTAVSGVKFTAVSGTLSFAPSETTRTITVPILNEGLVEGTKTFRVLLSNPTDGGSLGTRAAATVSITDNDIGVQFGFGNYAVAEDAGAVRIGIVRGDDGILPVTVELATTDLTGRDGVDYTGGARTLSFEPTERRKYVSIPILNNAIKEPNKTFRLTLSSPTGATLGAQKTATVTIKDNDQGFQFEFAGYTTVEDAGVVLIRVLRGTDDTGLGATVDFETNDGTAAKGEDYSAMKGTLAFGPGEKEKVLPVPILNNGLKEATENFRVVLSNPTGGGTLGAPATATVSILDNDPGITFELARYATAWGQQGSISLTVLRGNDGDLGPISVDYATSDLTAIAGQDYQAVSGTIDFQAGETLKSLAIPVLRDRPGGGTKSFRVTLRDPTGGATIGVPTATVDIVGTFFSLAPPFDPMPGIGRQFGANLVTWIGDGQLQRADRLEGPWQGVSGGKSPFYVQSPNPSAFYRLTRPRPVNVYVPSSYDGHTPIPLVILLHGYGQSGGDTADWLRIPSIAESQGLLWCAPGSRTDSHGNEFWNATDACCDFDGSGEDDAGYLEALIQEIAGNVAVDRKRVYLIGLSNGAFMAHRMALRHADLVAGIAAIAGMGSFEEAGVPSQPVNILHIHGTADTTVSYGGGAMSTPDFPANMAAYPGA